MAIITPTLHMLLGDRNRRWSWLGAIAELVDNSFDAGANQVVIEIHRGKPQWFSITDDGVGANDILDMIQIGATSQHATTCLGQYGRGLKDAWLWTSNHIDIETTKGRKTARLSMGFDDFTIKNGVWRCPDPKFEKSKSSSGTHIIFSEMEKHRRLPRRSDLNPLGLTFLPALRDGRQILIKDGRKKHIRPYAMPRFIEGGVVETSFEVNGKGVSIRIGITEEGCKPGWSGFLVTYGHRVIKETTLGTGKYNVIRISGEIALSREWKITTHKDDFAEYADHLGDTILDHIQGLLEKAESISDEFVNDELQSQIESMLNKALRNTKKKESRKPPENPTGTVLQQWTDRKRRKASKVRDEPGGVEESDKGTKRGVHFKWCSLDPICVGQCDPSAKSVQLNADNHFMQMLRKTQNSPAIYAVVSSLIANNDTQGNGGQKLMRFAQPEFSNAMGALFEDVDFDTEDKLNG